MRLRARGSGLCRMVSDFRSVLLLLCAHFAISGNTLGTRYKPCQAAAEGLFTHTSSSRIRTSTVGPMRPEGPQYWHSSSQYHPSSSPSPSRSSSRNTRPTSSPYYVYTFFSANVSSSPHFTFPPSNHHHHHRVSPPPVTVLSSSSTSPPQMRVPQPRLQSPPAASYEPTFFDRGMTQSPEAIWESEAPNRIVSPSNNNNNNGNSGPMAVDSRLQVAYDGGVLLDLDGVAIPGGIAEVPTQPNSPDKLGEGISLPER